MKAAAFTGRLARTLGRALPWLAPIALGLLVVIAAPPGVERLRDFVFDAYQRVDPRPWSPDLPVRIVAIDDAAIAREGQWPWPRVKIAELIERIQAGNPAAIGIDLLFSEEDRLSPDAILKSLPDVPEKEALAQSLSHKGLAQDPLAKALSDAPTIAAMVLTQEQGEERVQPKAGFVVTGDDLSELPPRFRGALLPLPSLREAALGLGALNYRPDRDLIVRRAPLVLALQSGTGATLLPSFALEALRVAQFAPQLREGQPGESPIITATGASRERSFGNGVSIASVRIGDIEIPTEADGQVRVRYAGHQPSRFISAARLLAGDLPRDDIEGRVILIGVTAASLGDIRSTPIDAAVPGVEVHAEVIEHAVSGAKLARPDYAPGVEALALLIGGLAAAYAATRLRPVAGAGIVLLLVAGAAAASWFAFQTFALLFDPLVPSAALLVTWGSSTVVAFRRTETERRAVRTAFSRYLAPAVVERLAADPGALRLGGEARELTVLFCDVRNFTSRAETLDAPGIVAFLHRLLTPLTEAVLQEAGTIDKYLGDGLMAFWNAPLDVPDHATRACLAALAMQQAASALDDEMRREAEAAGRPHLPVRIGIGINTGDAFVGNMGGEQRFDYSIIGDPVNVAARLETATKDFGVRIVVSESTMRATRGLRFVDLGTVSLKGRSVAARVYALHGIQTSDDGFDSFAPLHEAVLAAAAIGSGLEAAIEAAERHPLASRYAGIYARLLRRDAVPPPA